ncbi:MAG: hypothetical protein ACREPP_02755 [Rhodanobacteraceae bacterium]
MKPILATAALALLTASLPAWSQETHEHPAPEKLGSVSFPTSCAPAVGPQFARAVALLHSFAYSAAQSAFRDVAAADPGCAMAHWGIAMSYYQQLWSPPGAAALGSGWAEVQQAQALHVVSPREQQYIAAAAAYFHDADHVAHAARAAAYAEAMGELARGNPQDTEAQLFYALALLATAAPDDRTHANQKRAVALIEPIFRAQPDHPGAAHYLIHACDSTELAAQGLQAARAYAKIAPSAPHALHMPSHIYTRLGLWDDSIASNIAARAAAHAQGDQGEEMHAMDYLTYAYLQSGRDSEAERVVADLGGMRGIVASDFKMGYAATDIPVRVAMERHQWDQALRLEPLADLAPHVAAIVYWAHAVSYARSGRGAAAAQDLASLEACRQRLLGTGGGYWAAQVGVLGQEAKAWQLASTGNRDESVALMRQAADAEDALEKLPVTPGPVVPAREQLGELLLEQHHPAEALQAFQQALASAPGRRGALSGIARARAQDAGR